MRAERVPARREIMSESIQLQRPTERGDLPGNELEDRLRAEAELQPEMSMAQVA
jgi:hypothetical protein